MRLGLIIYGSLATVSGGYLYDRKLVEHLRRAGDTVDILSLPWRNYARHLSDNFAPPLLGRLRSAHYDALLQDELNHPSLFWLNRQLRGRYPLYSIVHHLRSCEARPAWQNVFYRAVERRYLRGVEGFIFNSETTRAAVVALVGHTRRAVVAHPAGDHLASSLTEAEINLRARTPGPLRVLFIGNVIPRKGLPTLLRALAQLPRAAWRLTVVGSLTLDAPHARAVQKQISDLALTDNVTLRGALVEAPLMDELKQAHVLAVPSEYEGFGIVYLEALAFGLPAIASTAGAAREIITHGADGFLIAPGDAEGLAAHLRALAEDRALLATLGRAALARFKAHPTWAESAERIRHFLLTH